MPNRRALPGLACRKVRSTFSMMKAWAASSGAWPGHRTVSIPAESLSTCPHPHHAKRFGSYAQYNLKSPGPLGQACPIGFSQAFHGAWGLCCSQHWSSLLAINNAATLLDGHSGPKHEFSDAQTLSAQVLPLCLYEQGGEGRASISRL